MKTKILPNLKTKNFLIFFIKYKFFIKILNYILYPLKSIIYYNFIIFFIDNLNNFVIAFTSLFINFILKAFVN